MPKTINFLLLILFLSCNLLRGQTSEYGNLKIYTREAYLSSLGYYSGSHLLPAQLNPSRLDYSGIGYTNDYDILNIGNIVLNNFSEIRFTLDGIFRIGFGFAKINLDSLNEFFPEKQIQYYQLNLDLFTLSLNPEYTLIFKHGYAITTHFGIDLINVGGNISVLQNGNLLKHSVAQMNLVPLAFRPAIYFDFGNSGLGIGAYINPLNILSFRYSSKDLYPEDKIGIKTFDDFFRRYEFQIIFTF